MLYYIKLFLDDIKYTTKLLKSLLLTLDLVLLVMDFVLQKFEVVR
jgi:hypothetical protein